MNIYAKLTILCVFLVVFTSSVLYYFVNLRIQKTFREELLSNVTHQSEETISVIGRFIFSRLNDLRMAAKNPYFRANGVSQETLIQRLQELENLNDLYYSFSFFDNNRVRIADSKRLSIGKQHGYSNYWTSITPDVDAVVDISKSESVERVVMHFAAVVKNANQTEGVIVGRILINELYQILGNISIGSDSVRNLNVTLVNRDGLILYSNAENVKVMTDQFQNFDVIKGAIPEGQQRVSFLETDDELYFVAKERGYLNYAGNDWSLIVSISKEDAFLPLREIQSQLLLVILSVLAVSIVMALIAANLFVRPIVRLSKAAENIGEGKLDTEIKIKSNDEVGRLAKQLTKASESLITRLDEQKQLNEKLESQKNEMTEQKTLLESANKQVSDSIIYAMRIQRSILPDLSVISKLVKDAFVMYEPKDVVSGDFYWFERVRQGRNEYLIIACADCTGHGVPGAIMSIMGSNQLTNIVYYQNYIDPNKILARLDKVIKFELQRDDDEANRDGMEIGICVINLDDLTMEFSGAGIPLYLKKKGSKELTIYKSPKYMIGGIDGDEKEVSSKLIKEEIQLAEGDKLFMASDGFQDQFGGPDDKKFMSKNLKKLLEDTSKKAMKTQEKDLQKAFRDWRINTPQTDDVLVMGIEI